MTFPVLSRLLGFGESITAANLNEFLVGLIPAGKLGTLLGRALEELLVQYPLPVTAVIGLAAGWLSTGGLAARVHDHALAEFNDDVLSRIPQPRPFDPLRGAAGLTADDVVLPWYLEPGSPRQDLWDRAERLTQEHLEQHRRREAWHNKPRVPFGWTLLVGRPGSGKSRLATEYARHVAQRNRFGDDGDATRWTRLRTWWRIAVLGRAPSKDDPWDAGWLSPGAGTIDGTAYPTHVTRRGAHPVWLERLGTWRPRRPTLLLLDDPRPGDAREIIGVLEKASEQYGHAVRLLIVNQSAPAELGLRRHGERWTVSGGMAPLVAPLVFMDEMRLDEADIRRLRGTRAMAGRFPLATDPAVQEFLRITRGNALLVELGFRWLRRGATLEAMTGDALLNERVDRILDALQEAGLGEVEHWRAVAVATLAGGADAELASAVVIAREFPIPLKIPEELARVFPMDRADLRNTLPPIRPELIGDAFVAHVVAEAPQEEQRRMVATAWAANPRGTLRSALRCGGRNDDLGRLLREGPPASAGLNRLAVAQAFADMALWLGPRAMPEEPEARETLGLVLAAGAECLKLSPEEAQVMLDWLLDQAGRHEEQRSLRLDDWFVLVGKCFKASFSGAPQRAALAVTLAERLFPIAERRLGFGTLGADAAASIGECWRLAAASADWGPESLRRLHGIAETWCCDDLALNVATAPSEWLSQTKITEDEAQQAIASHVALAFLSRISDAAVSRGHAEAVDRIAARFKGDRDFQLQRAKAWSSVAHSTREPVLCRGHAEAVDRIAARFAADRDFQLQRAKAWGCVASAVTAEPAVCRGHAETVDRIAARFTDDHDFQLQRAKAWGWVVQVTVAEPAVCRGHAATVDRIAAPFPDSRDFQFERAQAWTNVAFATRTEHASCRSHAETVDRISALFPGDRNFQIHRAQAWRYVAASSMERAACRGYAEAVDLIAAPFPADRDFQLQRATAWRYVAATARAEPATCRRVAQAIDRIAEPFAVDRYFQLQRATAWSEVAYATMEEPTLCRAHAEAIDRIANGFAADREFQHQRAKAWRYAAAAARAEPLVCLSLAKEVECIAGPFASDRDLQLERATAWFCVAHATSAEPMVCRAHAQTVDRIATRFKLDRDFQLQRARAWHCVAYATKADPTAFFINARMVDNIVAQFPHDAEFVQVRRAVWNYAR